MRVILKKTITGTIGHFEAGTTADLPDAMAVSLIECGAAAPVVAEIERAVITPLETAAPLVTRGRKTK